MRKTYTISSSEAKIIREKMNSIKKVSVYKRLEVIALLGEGKTPAEVAEITSKNAKYVRTLGNLYNKVGFESYANDGRTGGNNRLMSKEDAKRFLSQFESLAEKGQIITVEDIAKSLDEVTGKERASLSTVYKFLHRNGWRKVMPRPKHPNKASEEAIEASKKLT